MQLVAFRATQRGIDNRRSEVEGSLVRRAQEHADLIVNAAKETAQQIISTATEEAQHMRDAAVKALAEARHAAVGSIEEWLDATITLDCDKPIPGERIIKAVALKHNVQVAAIMGPSKSGRIVAIRHEAMVRVYQARPDLSLPQIGKLFDRDHTSVLHALRKVRANEGSLNAFRRKSA